MYNKRRIRFSWVLIVLNIAVASCIFYLRHFDEFYRILADIFYFLGGVSFIYFVFKEYHEIFLKPEGNDMKIMNNSKNLLILIIFSIFIINTILFILFSLLIIAGVMMSRIYLQKKSLTYLFMFFALISASLTVLFSLLANLNLVWSWELAYVSKFNLFSFLLATGLSSPVEEKLKKSEKEHIEAYNRAEFYKDLFAHDMNNILQNILSSIDLIPYYLEEQENKEKIYSLINVAKDQVNRGANLSSNVRHLSELEKGDFSLKKIEVMDVLNKAVKYVRESFHDKELQIDVISEVESFFMMGNQLLMDLFENLLINAIKHNENEKIEILIKISELRNQDERYLKIQFIDNGIGIPDKMKEKIFQESSLKTRKSTGMGLGLSLVKKILDTYKGEIWVEDKVKGNYSRGSNFIILLPAI